MKTIFKLSLLLAILPLVGCTTTHISKAGDSYTVIRKTFFTKHTIAGIDVSQLTNGTTFSMSGYKSDGGVTALEVAVGAAVKAAISSASPAP